jgi:hypothetical protein
VQERKGTERVNRKHRDQKTGKTFQDVETAPIPLRQYLQEIEAGDPGK